MKIKLLVLISIFSVGLFAQNASLESSSEHNSINPNISISAGTVNGIESSRFNLKYYHNDFVIAVNFTDYDTFKIGDRPYKKDTVLSQKEYSIMLDRVFYSLEPNPHISMGTGIVYRTQTVRDEWISYENWSEKENSDLGLPLDLNIETFFAKSHLFFNFGAKVVFFKDETELGLTLDLGFWL